jgi:glycosyltransferase involved in cell wall biosynthesis
MRILFDSRWIGPHGIGRVAQEYRAILGEEFEIIDLDHGPAPSGKLDSVFTARAFTRSKADVFFTPGYNGSPFIAARQVIMIHDLIHLQPGQSGRGIRALYYDTIIRATARRSLVITVSHFSKAAIEQRWPELAGRVVVIPNGVSAAFCAPRPISAVRCGIVVFTNDRWHKNFDGMCRALVAWQAADDQAAGHPVYFVGRPVDGDAHPTFARIQHGVAVHSADDTALADLLASSAALLTCSHHEGFGLPVVEALATGCVPVVSDLPVFREIAGDHGVFADNHDPAAIARALSRAIRTTVPVGVSDAVKQRFAWEQSGGQMVSAVRGMVGA